MTDEDFELFIEEFGGATTCSAVSKTQQERWRKRLPDRLLRWWDAQGWGGYAGGLFWLVDPELYEDLVDEWLIDTGLEEIDSFHTIARTAFGKLYLFGERTGQSVTINCLTHAILALPSNLRPKSIEGLDLSIGNFLGLNRSDCDLKDELGESMFQRAMDRLGPLTSDEMYSLEPAIALGGRILIENVRKVKTDQHLTILRQLAPPYLPLTKVALEKIGKQQN